MSAVGLLAGVKWQCLFPGLRDYRSLASLPLQTYHVFMAKLLALLLVATAAIVPLNLLPGVLFPMISESRWATNPSLSARVLVHVFACVAGSYFFFFGLVAIQGVLLVVLRPRFFNLLTKYLQGLLVPAMLALIVLSFSIQPTIANRVLQPNVARWLPPVWFLGLYQWMLGDSDPQMLKLAHLAMGALLISILLTLATYIVSYHRHRAILVEGVPATGRSDRLFVVLDWVIPEPHQKAVVSFMIRTLAASAQHRTILMGYLGFGLAILLSGLAGIRNVVQPGRLIAASFVYAHVVVLIFLLVGFRHLFAIPTELGANWIFRITEQEGRGDWLVAVDRFVLFVGAAGIFLIPFSFEFKLLGWRAISELVLLGTFGLLCFDWVFYSWEKLLFTCSHLPAKFPIWNRALQLFGLLTLLAPMNAILIACLYNPLLFSAVLVGMFAIWIQLHANRVRARREVRLKFDELPEPAILSLSLLK
jgi:hypothetical protein